MKNIFKIILILCLGIFVAAGCADDSSGGGTNTENTGGDNTGDGDNNGGDNDTPEFTKLISLGGLSYGETADGKRYVWGNAGELAGAGNKDEVTTPVEVDFTINKILDNDTKYVLTDKGLYAWGNNENGQVGNGESGYEKDEDGKDDYNNPKKVLKPYKAVGGNINEFRVSDSGRYVTYYALTADGLYAWGNNEYGQAGNGTTDDVLIPHKVEGITGNIKEFIISGGYRTTCYVLTENGALYVWGNNRFGQAGNNTTTENVTTPHKVEGIDGTIKEIITGDTVYVLTDKGLYAWGYNIYGQVGNGDFYFVVSVLTPHKVEGITGTIKEIITGDTVYVLTDTGLYAWGNNYQGQVGNGTNDDTVLKPHKVEGIDGNINEVIAGRNTVYVLTEDGALYAWGDNRFGQVGNGTTDDVLIPHKVEGIAGNIKEFIISDSSRDTTCYVLTENGALYAWGYNEHGQVGNGTTENVTTPYEAVAGNIKEFRVSGYGSYATYYALTEDGLYAWGNNRYGQVGNGESGYEKDEDGNDDRSKPKKVLKPNKAVAGNIKEFIISGSDNSATYYALTEDGLYAWGFNYQGQVGNGTTDDVLTPHKVERIDGNIKEVITGDTVYVLTDKGLYAWGYNSYGQVGNGESGYEKDEYGNDDYSNSKKVLTPHKVEGIDGTIKEIITGSTVYVLTDKGLYAWGWNGSGQAGSGTTDDVTTPHKVEGIDGTIKEIITGYTVYVLTDTGLYAWGYNKYGQVGNGESGYEKDEYGYNDYDNPKKVLKPYKAVAGNIKEFIISGSDNSATYYALTDKGLYAWGNNESGQVGNGTTENVTTPYEVQVKKQN